ncbi:ATP-dependent zinc metalloprotease yme1l1 [Mactra antiquata]
MFSSAVFQPPVFETASHIICSVRTSCNGILRVRGLNTSSCMNEISELKQTWKNLDLEECINILMRPEYRRKLCAMLGINDRSHWINNYVSSPTFFENKTGFTEQMLVDGGLRQSGITLFLHPEVRHLLSPTLSPVYIQTRGFKQQKKASLHQDSHPLDTILKNENKSIKDKIKLAYAEGIISGQGGATEKGGSKFWKNFKSLSNVLFTCFVIVIALKLMVAVKSKDDRVVGGLFGGGNQLEVRPELVNVTFEDVKGCDEAKEELLDIVSFLKNSKKFHDMGAKLPKGVLMDGPPGVGKTLLAKAVAGEAGVPFFQMSGSEFDELFVGMGAKRVRQLFAAAKAKAPCVVFIDEIDSVGGKRSSSHIHPYANQTINQLLAEMDGFATESGVIVLGATNKKDNLDKALLRPGRFDTEVTVMRPDINGRTELFELYLSKIKKGQGIDVKKLASMTFGATGAEIANIVNQAALYAAIQNNKCVTMHHLEHAFEKQQMGPAWKNRKLSVKERKNTAYHEAGHAMISYYTKCAAKLRKVTILARGHSLGHTSLISDEDEAHSRTKAMYLASIDVAMGGRAAEHFVFGMDNVTAGAYSDFERATSIAKSMVQRFGMSEKAGVRIYGDELSTNSKHLIDSEVDEILKASYDRAYNVLKSHQKELDALADALIVYETLDFDEVDTIMKGKKLKKTKPTQKRNQTDSEQVDIPTIKPTLGDRPVL